MTDSNTQNLTKFRATSDGTILVAVGYVDDGDGDRWIAWQFDGGGHMILPKTNWSKED
jgi:hypothetical protein